MCKRMRVARLHSHTAFLNYRLEEKRERQKKRQLSKKTGNYYNVFGVLITLPWPLHSRYGECMV